MSECEDNAKTYGVFFRGDEANHEKIRPNDAISSPIGDPLHDEKILRTVHIAIGENTMFGGVNEAVIHHDFVFTPDKNFADDALIYVKNTLQII